MSDEQQVDIAGAELASEVVHDGRLVLLVFLVRGEDGEALELGAWSATADGKLTRPPRPLIFSVGEVDRVRALAERAVETLPRASYGEDGIAVLGHDGGLTANRHACAGRNALGVTRLGGRHRAGHGSGCWDRELRPGARGGGA